MVARRIFDRRNTHKLGGIPEIAHGLRARPASLPANVGAPNTTNITQQAPKPTRAPSTQETPSTQNTAAQTPTTQTPPTPTTQTRENRQTSILGGKVGGHGGI